MTLAEQFKAKRQPDYASPVEFLKIVQSVDPKSGVKADDLGVVIIFSDGSIHRIEKT